MSEALSRIDGIEVPPGFCATTTAFRRVMADGLLTTSASGAPAAPAR